MPFPHLKDGFTALVIGAGSGIGAGLVRKLLYDPQCATVHAASRSATDSTELPDDERLYRHELDVTSESRFRELAANLQETGQSLDLIIYAVGVLHDDEGLEPEKKLADIQLANLLKSFSANTFGAMLAARHFSELMPASEGSVFAAISARVGSISDNRLGGWYAYRASKAALNQFLKTLSVEFSRRRKRAVVLSLHPGTTDTQLSAPFQAGVPEGKLFSVDYSCECLLKNIAAARPDDSGSFIAWDGKRIEW
ncbi:MAG: SDR family NAD(P)-dependent oxidoreductase [Gammaproteobacteria bacterium]|nr:SDR family NAD(P)-dependent oxidoreductase [Gammaproteobacteria bacterium]